MDNPTVTAPRDTVPDWAKPGLRDQELNGEPPASDPQLSFLKDLIVKKDLSSLKPEQSSKLLALLDEETFWASSTTRLTKTKASRILDILTGLPNKPREAYSAKDIVQLEKGSPLSLVPAGRYAVENNEGELRFYQVWESYDKQAKRLYVQHSDDMSKLPMSAQQAIAQKILDAGLREAAIRYGMEIGSCSNCGRTLTNRISRELGIGPICGGRMFGDDFKTDVKKKRQEILDRGEDPNEVLS